MSRNAVGVWILTCRFKPQRRLCLGRSPALRQTAETDEPEFLTEAELQIPERDNLLRILTKTNWRIKGPDGAAELLGIKPTTLLSRIDKWELKKPAAS